MANFKKTKITQPFHLDIKQAKEITKNRKAYGRQVICLGLNPLPSLGGLHRDKKTEEILASRLAKKGFLVVSVGADVPKDKLKEGDIVGMPHREAVTYAETLEVIIDNVVPKLRKYTLLSFDEHNISHYILDGNVKEETEENVNIELLN